MNFIIRIILVCLSLFWSVLYVQAAPKVVAELDSAKLLMGNTVDLTLQVEMPSRNSKIRFPLMEVDSSQRYVGILNDSIEISTAYTLDTIKRDAKDLLKYNLTIQAFDSGRYVLPKFEFIIDNEPVYSNALTLDVLPVKVKADDKLDDFSNVADPFEVGFADSDEEGGNSLASLWWLWILLGLSLALIVFGLLKYRKTGHVFTAPKQLTPYEAAMKRIRDLRKKKLWENGKEKEYYSRLVDVMRIYLHDRFGISAMEMTSRQIMKAVRKNNLLKPLADEIKPVLDISDFVKFARVKPLAADNEDVIRRVEDFVTASNQKAEILENEEKEKGGNQ